MNEYFNPEIIIRAYSQGWFPMAESRDGEIFWHSPDPRAVFPLNELKPSRSMRQFYRKFKPEFRINADFAGTVRKCAVREDTWINDDIIANYEILHKAGFAHSIETVIDGQTAGGLYGVALGGAFFGESMYSTISNASKAAFYYLVQRLRDRNFVLLDTQYLNEHTESLGAVEIPRSEYLRMLGLALEKKVRFTD